MHIRNLATFSCEALVFNVFPHQGSNCIFFSFPNILHVIEIDFSNRQGGIKMKDQKGKGTPEAESSELVSKTINGVATIPTSMDW